MQLGKLMNFLNECYGVQGKIHVLSDDAIQIQTCEIIENGQHSCVSGCLYLCHAAELSRILETLKKEKRQKCNQLFIDRRRAPEIPPPKE